MTRWDRAEIALGTHSPAYCIIMAFEIGPESIFRRGVRV